MDQTRQELNYSSKNIPIHSEREYKYHFLRSFEKFRHNLLWRVFFFLTPIAVGHQKETFGLNSSRPPPVVPELKPFFTKMEGLLRGVEFKKFSNPLQTKLKKDRQKISQNNKLLVPADKTRNFYSLEKEKYVELLDKDIHKSYKKTTGVEVENIDIEQRNIVENLDLTDRNIFKIQTQHAKISLKDHKENFNSNPSTRLVNPTKPEVGKISKKILDRMNSEIRRKTNYNQWLNSDSVISWFKNIGDKHTQTFILFDVVSMYPSISEKLLVEALQWASGITKVTNEEKNIILKSKRSLLYDHRGEPFVKKGGSNFDITMGSWDGAESCDLVSLFLLGKVQHLNLNIGAYRDDWLAVSHYTARVTEMKKKELCKIFKAYGLNITIEANQKKINFLDITLDLDSGLFQPFTKANANIKYVHIQSNHPPTIKKNLPRNINNRLSRISSNAEVFDKAKPPYQSALREAGYGFDLKFDQSAAAPSEKKRRRSRRVTWWNPPWSDNVKTHIGKEFIKIIKTSFPPNHKLHKICNTNTLKLSYSCLPNMSAEISKHNSKILKPDVVNVALSKSCNCRDKTTCPLPQYGCMAMKSVVYQATVTREDNNRVETYAGLTADHFKVRWRGHNWDLSHSECRGNTALAGYVWSLKDSNIPHSITWDILGRAPDYNPVTKTCRLCTLEKFFIIYHPTRASLNQRSEIFTPCLHRDRNRLFPRRKKLGK